MYRTSSHEPRYSQSTRKTRHDDSREAYDNSSSEEDEVSTESQTDESDDTTETQGSESFAKGSFYSEGSESFHIRPGYNKQNDPDSFTAAHVCHSRILKHDKVTQKNLLSPFPSFTVPPIYREIAGYRGSSRRTTRENQVDTKSYRRHTIHNPERIESFGENEDSICYIHNCERDDRRTANKHRNAKNHGPHHYRSKRSERILTCVNASKVMEPPGKPQEVPVKDRSQQPLSEVPIIIRRPKTADQETAMSGKFQEIRGRTRRKSATGASSFPVDQSVVEAIEGKVKRNGKVAGNGSGEVKEKLVYVVEEKGKNVTKLETDLFTLNEILTIKKDLLELSEFAKKLKKLKEMKRVSESGTNHPNSCHCKPAAELLKDVNKRIEALEARQEELERGDKSEQKGDTETESKQTMNGKKGSFESQSKSPIAMKASAMTTIPVFPIKEMSRADNVSNNSEIVNELMDIKTQLHKLEQKRMSKAVFEDTLPAEDLKLPKKEEHAIAVFSSRTYILTDQIDKGKEEMKNNGEEKVNNYCSTVEGESRKDQTKENVTNWLKTVTPKNQEIPYLPPSGQKRERTDESSQRGSERKGDLRCKNCSQVLKADDFQNQEPQKNRATEKGRKVEGDVDNKDDFSGKISKQAMKYKECIVTPSGNIFAYINSSCGRISSDFVVASNAVHSLTPQSQPLGNDRTESSCSTPSVPIAKEYFRKLKKSPTKRRRYGDLLPRIIKSKSMDELSGNSRKTEKTLRNNDLKNKNKMAQPKEKKHKNSKNQCLKLLEAHLLALRKTLKKSYTSTSSSCTYSEFLASVNLDTASTSQSNKFHGNGDNKEATVVAYSSARPDDGIPEVENCEKEKSMRRVLREEERKRKKRETECRKMLKRKLKEQKKCDSLQMKRREDVRKNELKLLKQRCKELHHCGPSENCVMKKKSRSLENVATKKRPAEARKSRSSEDLHAKKSYGTDESTFRKSCSSDDSVCRRKRQHQEGPRKRYCCELERIQKQRYEEECGPRKYRYGEEYVPRKYRYEEEHVPSRHQYEDEHVHRRHRYGEEHVPRKHHYEEEYVPRKHRYEDEEEHVPRKHRYEEEEEHVPRKYRYEEEEEHVPRKYRYEEEEGPSRHYMKDEFPRNPLYEEDRCPRKSNHSPKEKQYKEEEYKRSFEEKSTTSQCGKSEESMKAYRKQVQDQLEKMKYNLDKQPVETCKLKNVIKKFGKFKINFPFAGEFCDGKHENCKKLTTSEMPEKVRRSEKPEKSQRSEKPEKPTTQEARRETECEEPDDNYQWELTQTYEEYEDDDEDNNDNDGYNRYRTRHHDQNGLCESNRHHYHQQPHNYSHHGSDFPGNCRCVRVYLQSQLQKGWSGLRPFQRITTDNGTEGTSSKTVESFKSVRSNFALPKVKPPVFQVCYSCEPKRNNNPKNCKKIKKCKKEKHRRKHHKKHKCKCKKVEDHCKCKKCGNIHRKGCNEESVRCPPPQIEMPKGTTQIQQERCTPPRETNNCESDSLPLFSLLTQFCKSKSGDRKAAKFFQKLDEVRYLKTCPIKRSTKRRGDKSDTCCHLAGRCKCRPTLDEIESRLSILENRKSGCKRTYDKEKKKNSKRDDIECSKSMEDFGDHQRKTCGGCQRKDCGDCQRRTCGGCQRKDCGDCQRKTSGGYQRKDCDDCQRKACGGCQRKDCGDCQRKTSGGYQRKDCDDYQRKTFGGCQRKDCDDCQRKTSGGCQRKDCCKCQRKEGKKRKKKKKKSDSEDCSDDNSSSEKKKKHKKRKKCKCCECETGECGDKAYACVPGPSETAAYYQTIYCSSANSHNNSTSSITPKTSMAVEKESMGNIKSKEEPPQKNQRMKDGLSSLHSFWKNLRKISNGRNGMENLMKRIRRKKSACVLEPDISIIDDCSKGSPMHRYRQVTEMEKQRPCGKSKSHREERKQEKKKKKSEKPDGRNQHAKNSHN